MGFYKHTTSNEIKCMPCPDNSWSSKLGADKCECQNGYFRESELDATTDCKPIKEITATNLNIVYVDDEKINISISRLNLDLSSNIRIDLQCFECILGGSDCISNNCIIDRSSNDW
jgi:hypothetical protein